MRTISSFWLAYCYGLLALSPQFAERDEPTTLHPGEHLSMGEWLRLKECERAAILATYSARTPPRARYIDTTERRTQSPGLAQ